MEFSSKGSYTPQDLGIHIRWAPLGWASFRASAWQREMWSPCIPHRLDTFHFHGRGTKCSPFPGARTVYDLNPTKPSFGRLILRIRDCVDTKKFVALSRGCRYIQKDHCSVVGNRHRSPVKEHTSSAKLPFERILCGHTTILAGKPFQQFANAHIVERSRDLGPH